MKSNQTKRIDTIVQQEIDRAVQKIVNQGGRCLSEDPGIHGDICSYANDGKRCVVGWMVSEPEALEAYSSEFEGLNIQDIMQNEKMNYLFPSWAKDNVQLLLTLQRFHDIGNIRSRTALLKELIDLGLDTSALQYKQWVQMV